MARIARGGQILQPCDSSIYHAALEIYQDISKLLDSDNAVYFIMHALGNLAALVDVLKALKVRDTLPHILRVRAEGSATCA